MNESERKLEHIEYINAVSWLRSNGNFEVFPFKKESKFKIVFTKNETSTELIGEDLVRLTLEIYNEIKD